MIVARRLSLGWAVMAATLFLLVSVSSASAAAPVPRWTMITQAAPTDFHLGDSQDFYEVMAFNDGAADTSGEITLTDTLPEGVSVESVKAYAEFAGGNTVTEHEFIPCEEGTARSVVTVTCTASTIVPIGRSVVAHITVDVPAEGLSSPLLNVATIDGGGAPEAGSSTTSTPLTDPAQAVPYGASLVGDVTDDAGVAGTQAGSHPFSFSTLVAFNVASVTTTEQNCFFGAVPSCAKLNAQAKDVEVALPAGLVGNPTAWPQCTQAQFEFSSFYPCPANTQVGDMYLYFYGQGTEVQYAPVYNIEPPVGEPGELGFSVSSSAHVPIFFHVRSDGDYGLTTDISNINQFVPVRIAALSIWGNPGDEAHNPRRLANTPGCENSQGGCPSGVENPKPFLNLPTSCPGSELPISVGGDSWQNPLFPYPVFQTIGLPGLIGCNQLEFEPTLEARPTTNVADSPSGLHVDLKLPQPEIVGGTAEAHLRDAVVTLPKGLTVNPSSAAGLEGCSPAQIGLTSPEGATPIRTTADPANCPDASKLGTVEVDTPLLKDPLPGAVYLATPYDNPFKSLLALYITVNDPKTGIVVKLASKVEVGADGQLTATLTEAPQTPFTDFKLDFFGGARAPLRTPAVCGTYETTSQLTPWSAPESGPPASKSDSYQISAGSNGHSCPTTEAAQPNSPSFEAGTASPLAGAYSPFSLHLHREDGSQNFAALNVNLPPGLIGKLAGVGECPDSALATAAQKTGTAEQASPSCPASSRVGTVNVAAGAGPSPYNATGTAYLAGPYKGAPLSLAIITPALAGPFDLGTVVVRNALYVNPETAQISVRSDPIPTALQGIQLDLRSIDLNIDRNQFTLNPTNCERMAVGAEAISSLGNIAPLTNPFQVGECAKLPFKPKLALKLKGSTKRTANPKLIATLTAKPGEANIARAQVKLPKAAFLDNAHIGAVCTRVQFAAHQCPPASVYGHARAITPLLDQPLEGPVYLRSSSHKLPDLVADLNGQIEVSLAGKTDSVKGALRNTFEAVPDAPVTSFRLELFGGKRGLIEMSSGFCKAPRAEIKLLGQNGKVFEDRPVVASSCKKPKKKGRYKTS
jgi:hypothetical protein